MAYPFYSCLYHWLYEAKIAVFPSIYVLYVSPVDIGKHKKVFGKKFHLHCSLIRTHWFQFKLFILNDLACFLCRGYLKRSAGSFFFSLSVRDKFFLVFLYLSFKFFYYLVNRRVYLACNSFCLNEYAINFEQNLHFVSVLFYTECNNSLRYV